MARLPRRSPFAGRHARAGVSFLAVAVILAATSVSVDLSVLGFASAEWRTIVATASHALEFAAVWVALPLGVALLFTAGEPAGWRRAVAVAAAVAAPIAVQLSGAARSPFLILIALAAAVGGYALIVFGLTEHRRDDSLPGRTTTAIAVLAAANLVVIALGTLHLLLWNPLARVPALDASQIYLVLGEGPGGVDGGPVAWAIVSTLATVAAAVSAFVGARRGTVNAHLVVTGGLLLIHATSFFLWWAGIGIGEDLAAAFGGSAGDASPAGSLIALAGASCLAAAILIQLLPAAVPVDDEADAADRDADGEGDGPADHGGDGGVPLAPASVTS
ncbi:hypothetical protein [Agromyces sp. ZXT2-6]|uniref:hypothetical protein n=1 Tax=Agromyces sp. ZXT2-6 TaxID=3461153 RepID=UPI004054BF22